MKHSKHSTPYLEDQFPVLNVMVNQTEVDASLWQRGEIEISVSSESTEFHDHFVKFFYQTTKCHGRTVPLVSNQQSLSAVLNRHTHEALSRVAARRKLH
jgi:hypothetical protein